jgi:CheY-like chemotaxis protein
MVASGTLLCIHRDPGQLDPLKEKGYKLITATNGSDGLRLLMSRPVDAIVLEYHLGLLNGAIVSDEIKVVRPLLPIVMLTDHLELPEGTLKSVDALVAKSDGTHYLAVTIHSVLQRSQDPQHLEACDDRSTDMIGSSPSNRQVLVVDDDPAVRESIALLLTSAGYDVIVAEDGFAGLTQLRKALPVVIVSDLDMPGMSGFELLSVIRRRFPQILTVAMSGAYSGEELPFSVIADAFHSKANPPKNLLRTVEHLIFSASQGNTHPRDIAPAWIPRNGNDSQGMPYVVLTCGECLRAFPMNLMEESTDRVLEIACRFCASRNKYIIQPFSQDSHRVFA